MKRKLFTFLMAFLVTLSGAVWAQKNYGTETAPLDLADRSVTVDDDAENWYITCSSPNCNNGINISGKAFDYISPTIHLVNVQSIKVTGSAIEIHEFVNDVNIVLHGENEILSDDGPAIVVPTWADLNISGDGSLEISMTYADNVAIGQAGGGADRDRYCGDVSIDGGTVVTNGVVGDFQNHDLSVNNDAVVIVGNFEGYRGNLGVIDRLDLNGGIWGENPDGIGYVQGDDNSATLKSPLPEGYKITLENEKTLVLGDDISINEDQVIEPGTVVAYHVMYKSPENGPVINNLPKNQYTGKNYTVSKAEEQTNTTQLEGATYKLLTSHWQDNNSWVAAETQPKANETVPSSPQEITYTGVWTLTEIGLDYMYDEGLEQPFNLWYPASAPLTATVDEGEGNSLLADVGLSQSNGVVSKADPLGELEAKESAKVKFNLSATDGPSSIDPAILTINIEDDKTDINDESISVTLVSDATFTYNGTNQAGAGIVSVTPTSGGSPYVYNVGYTLEFSTSNGEDASWSTEFKDAGEYYVKVIGKGVLKESKILDNKITMNKATLNLVSVSEEGITHTIDGEEGDPTFDTSKASEYVKLDGVKGEDNVSATPTATVSGGEAWKAKVGTYTVTFSVASLENNDPENYQLGTKEVTRTLTVKAAGESGDDTPTKPGDENEDGWTVVEGQTNSWMTVYNGTTMTVQDAKPVISIQNGEEVKDVTLEETWYSGVSYAKANDSEGAEPESDGVKNVGKYTATITFAAACPYFEEGATLTLNLEITKATLNITAKDVTCEIGQAPQTLNPAEYLTVTTVNNEKAAFEGMLTLKEEVTDDVKGEYADAYDFTNVSLKAEGDFNPANYKEPTWPQVKLIVGSVIINPGEDGEGGDDVIGGEDTDNDGDLDEDDIILISTSDATTVNCVYDGNPHKLLTLQVGDYTLKEGEHYTAAYTSDDTPSTEEGAPFHAAIYSATIEMLENSIYQLASGNTFTLNNIVVSKRPMTITFVDEVSSLDDLKDINKLVQCDGIVKGEWPEISAAFTAKAMGNNRYSVSITSISISNSNSFYLSDYNVLIDKNGDGVGDEEITDEDGDGSGVWEGDDDDTIDIEITINPDDEGDKDDDDDHNPGHGGSTGGINRPAKYYNIYVDTAATSDGVELSLSKDVVKEGNQVSVYIDKILEGYNAENMKVQIKRSLYGYWEEIEEGVQPGEYIIYNIYTDIYVKVTDVEKEDATGIDDLEGVKAYTKDGSIYVYTPNREEVIIISMSGAIIKNEEQVGLQSYSVSRGIYIVRIGDKVFKLKN